MRKSFTIAWVLLVCAVTAARADNCGDEEAHAPANHSDIIAYDETGMGYTDLIMVRGRTTFCIPRTPKLDVATLQNAKLGCIAKKGRLPELSELDNFASFISRNYLLEKKLTDKAVLNARFMSEERSIWTATVKEIQDPYHHKRALGKLAHLASSADMSKAKVEWVGTHLDNRDERPYLCVFDKPKS